MSLRDAAAGGRTFVSDSSASADRRMAGALSRIVSQGIAFNARCHGMPMPLSLVDEAGVFTYDVNKPSVIPPSMKHRSLTQSKTCLRPFRRSLAQNDKGAFSGASIETSIVGVSCRF